MAKKKKPNSGHEMAILPDSLQSGAGLQQPALLEREKARSSDTDQQHLEYEQYLASLPFVKIEAVAAVIAISIGTAAFVMEVSHCQMFDAADRYHRCVALTAILSSGVALGLCLLTIPCLAFIYQSKGVLFALPNFKELAKPQQEEIRKFFKRQLKVDLAVMDEDHVVAQINVLQQRELQQDRVMELLQASAVFSALLGILSAGILAIVVYW